MLQLIFATNNKDKVREIQAAIGGSLKVVSLAEAGINIDIPEPYETLEENAITKANTIHEMTSLACFSEDTGLEVDALNGAPGVKSARYAGEERSFDKNIDKLLAELESKPSRAAQFRTVVSLIWEEKNYLFEGICRGKIIGARRGDKGFGYDAVFVPEGSDKTFAEMTIEEKNRFSHRKKAADKLVLFLQQTISATASH